MLRSLILSAGVFQPLQPHPNMDSSSSSSRSAVRGDPSTTAQVPCVFNLPDPIALSMLISAGCCQGWSETVNRILERLSDQLSLRQSEQGHGTTSADTSHHDPDRPLRQNRAVSSTHSIGSESDDFDVSVFSRLIGKAPDMGSSQVFDQSSVLAEVTLSTGDDGGFGVCVCVCVCVLCLISCVCALSDLVCTLTDLVCVL